jgi:hypothetical protein
VDYEEWVSDDGKEQEEEEEKRPEVESSQEKGKSGIKRTSSATMSEKGSIPNKNSTKDKVGNGKLGSYFAKKTAP